MSEPDEITLWAWVFGDKYEQVFSVSIERNVTIERLKEAIQKQKASFKDIPACSLTVFKFDQPQERIKDPIMLEDCQPLEPLRKISFFWKENPKQGVINIILLRPAGTTITPSSSHDNDSNLSEQAAPSQTATISSSSLKSNISTHAARKRNLDDIGSDEERGKRHKADSSIVDDGPCYAKFGFDRLRHDNTPRDSVLRFYEQFWGVPLPQEHTSLKNSIHDPNDEENEEENEEENGGDVLPTTPPPIIDTNWRRLLIRAEYLRIYKWVEDMYTVGTVYRPSAVVVTGQPGIGKSLWAFYILRRRLGEKSVSLWCQGSTFYLFCSEGVFVVPDTFSFNSFSPRVWTIIDYAQSPSGIPRTLVTQFLPGVFPIYITPLQPNCWAGITKSWAFHQVIMNPWTRAEIEYANNFIYSNQRLDDVLQKYNSLGPTPRFCFELRPDAIACHISKRDSAIKEASLDLLKQHFSSSPLSLDTFSDKICLIRRIRGSALGYGGVIADFISVAVKQQVVQKLEEFSDDQLLDMWRFRDGRGITGSIFEVFVHRRFRTRISLPVHATPMVRSNHANSRWHASFSNTRPQSATVHGVAQQSFSLYVDVGSPFIYDTTTKLSIRPDVYYVPRSGQQDALDSFILHGGYLNIFQYTGYYNHDIKGGINEFLASCSGLPPRTNWRFVFVIPDLLDSFSCSPASSDSVVKDLGLYTARIPM